MKRKLEIALPFPPSVNHYWRHTRTGGHYVSKEGKAYRSKVFLACLAELPFESVVSVSVQVWLPDKRGRDLDNLWKVLLDSLTEAKILKDDNWQYVCQQSIKAVGELKIEETGEVKFVPEIKKGGQIIVTIEEM